MFGIRVFAGFLFVMGLASVSGAWAEDGSGAAERLYLHYCSSCHGKTGVGDGPLASLLQQKPTDLTRLAEASGGELSLLKLLRSIDGRQRVRAHGSSEMPVWGEVLGPRPGDSEAEQVRAAGKLLLLAYYVESLQRRE
jgi:mono/diheme cytochrome c family protein